jgi:hypothetical protein
VAAHAEISDVVEENDTCGGALVEGLAEERADNYVRPSRLVDDGSAEVVVKAAEAIAPVRERTFTQIGSTADYEARGLSSGVRVDGGDSA